MQIGATGRTNMLVNKTLPWYNITRIPDDCFDPLLKIVPEIFTSDFLAASKLAVLAPNSHHKEVAALEIGQSSIIASRNNCPSCRTFAARHKLALQTHPPLYPAL